MCNNYDLILYAVCYNCGREIVEITIAYDDDLDTIDVPTCDLCVYTKGVCS